MAPSAGSCLHDPHISSGDLSIQAIEIRYAMACIMLSIQTIQSLACYKDPAWLCFCRASVSLCWSRQMAAIATSTWKHRLQLPSAHTWVNRWHTVW